MSLKNKTVSALKWTFFSSGLNIFIRVIYISILARILSPEDFGLIGIVTIVIGFIQIYQDFGVSNSVIHSKTVSKKELDSLFWLNLLTGIILYILLILFSRYIAFFFQEKQLIELLYIAGLNFLILPFGQLYQTLLQKELVFKNISKAEIYSNISGMIITLILAILGYGVYSIVIGNIFIGFLKTIIVIIYGFQFYKPSFYFKLNDITKHLNYGFLLMGQNLINFLNSKISHIIIGKFIGITELGYFNLANQLVNIPASKINPVITKVMFPVFSKIQENNMKLKKIYIKTLKYIALINSPILLGLASVAGNIIMIFYGEKWQPAMIYIQILSLLALFRSLQNPMGALILSVGRVKLGFKWNIFIFCTIIPAIYIAAKYNAIVICIVLVFLQILYGFISYFLVIRKLIGECFKQYFKNSLIPVIYSISMFFVVIKFDFIPFYNIYLELIFKIIIGFFVYFIFMIMFEKKQILYLKSVFIKNN